MQKDEIIKLINTYWKFDNDQDTTSTWHDKQDLINEIEQLTIPVVIVPKGTLCLCGQPELPQYSPCCSLKCWHDQFD